jgi:hypothetical protein
VKTPLHSHRCPVCNETYPGYNADCKDEFIRVCAKCLAKMFALKLFKFSATTSYKLQLDATYYRFFGATAP